MATYKLIQDIEAEDHILGPLSLRQFIFALIAVFCFYICFISVAKHVAFMLLLFLPPGLFFGFFAVPFGRDQPTEVWALAKLRFYLKPRRRIWDQSGVKELVTITVPKKIEHVFTDGLSQNEVKSRLNALASTVDSRGWAVKNSNVNEAIQSRVATVGSSDRLLDMSTMPQEVPTIEVQASDDILDEVSNPVAQQFESMIDASTQAHRKELIDELNDIREERAQPQASQQNNWFMSAASQQPPANSHQPGMPVAQVPTNDDNALAAQLRAQNTSQQAAYANMRTVQPLGNQQPLAPGSSPLANDSATSLPPTAGGFSSASASAPDPAILSLANNNDLNVSTLAREAYKAKHGEEPPENEVVIPLR